MDHGDAEIAILGLKGAHERIRRLTMARIKVVELYGMEAKKVLGEDVPCVIVFESEIFGNEATMIKVAKRLKGEYHHHPMKNVVSMTNDILKHANAFTSGLTSFKTKDLHIGIFSFYQGMNLQPKTVVAVPVNQRMQYLKFKKALIAEVRRLPRLKKNTAWVIGSRDNSLCDLNVSIESVVSEQKYEIISTIENFFMNPAPYLELSLPPFRKVCFAGKPGTGKTMTAKAIAKYLFDEYGIKTMYVGGSSIFGCSFDLIKTALDCLKKIDAPTMIVVEEFDSFCTNPGDRSKILNFLDGFETPTLKHPMCLLVTTNHPENIDKAIIDRSGRINRIFWFNGIKNVNEANDIVDMYRGNLQLPEIVKLLVDKTPDFVKELLIELRWRKANGLEMTIDNIQTVIKAISGGVEDEVQNGSNMYF